MTSSFKNWPRTAVVCGGALLMSASVTSAQGAKTTEAEVLGHVVEVAQLEPTPQRIANLKLPAGFHISKFAELQNPRMLAVASDGTVYVSQRDPGNLVMLKDTNNDGRVDVQKIVATRKDLHGVTIHGSKLYFITIRELYVANIKGDGTLSTPRLLIKDLPDAGQHRNRVLAFGPDGMLYVSVGSTTNAADEANAENATILRMQPDGTHRKVFASGLRNTIGFGWHPTTKRMYGWDQGIDWLGDDEQGEEFNEIKEGKRYGWPYINARGKFTPHPAPPKAYTYASWAKMSTNPVLLYRAHSAGMQMTFYTANQFPSEYKNDAFIPMRGSWNRKPPSGYELVRVHFDKAGNAVSIQPFLTGFLLPTAAPGGKPGHFARLAGVAVAKDGALLLGDDTNGIIYRISYGAANTKRAHSTALDDRKITGELPEGMKAPRTITITSKTFAPNGEIPFSSTAYDKNISPSLSWSNVPKGTKSFALMVEDPDSLSPKPFAHWIVANIGASVRSLPSGLSMSERLPQLGGAQQGSGHASKIGYFGPKPPAGSGPHHYHFQVFAIDTRLKLASGYNRQALVDAINGHVLAKGEVVGVYER